MGRLGHPLLSPRVQAPPERRSSPGAVPRSRDGHPLPPSWAITRRTSRGDAETRRRGIEPPVRFFSAASAPPRELFRARFMERENDTGITSWDPEPRTPRRSSRGGAEARSTRAEGIDLRFSAVSAAPRELLVGVRFMERPRAVPGWVVDVSPSPNRHRPAPRFFVRSASRPPLRLPRRRLRPGRSTP
jgi:hypothetical protein